MSNKLSGFAPIPFNRVGKMMLLFSIILIVWGSISYLLCFERIAVWLFGLGIGFLVVSLYLIKFVRE